MASNLVSRSILQETWLMCSAKDEILVFYAFHQRQRLFYPIHQALTDPKPV